MVLKISLKNPKCLKESYLYPNPLWLLCKPTNLCDPCFKPNKIFTCLVLLASGELEFQMLKFKCLSVIYSFQPPEFYFILFFFRDDLVWKSFLALNEHLSFNWLSLFIIRIAMHTSCASNLQCVFISQWSQSGFGLRFFNPVLEQLRVHLCHSLTNSNSQDYGPNYGLLDSSHLHKPWLSIFIVLPRTVLVRLSLLPACIITNSVYVKWLTM